MVPSNRGTSTVGDVEKNLLSSNYRGKSLVALSPDAPRFPSLSFSTLSSSCTVFPSIFSLFFVYPLCLVQSSLFIGRAPGLTRLAVFLLSSRLVFSSNPLALAFSHDNPA